ncbi:cytochrome b5 reductase domain-containing protein [Tribonema minus]|uniref:Cytochrome b5 reductase domain-containing protein n=1 Tax=Tribonema minus TaxID=303371 RepID=A0A836CM13_9STRA|nr:cytochrome b5 reductase domain-containing protein [Tribonema minus]
MPPPVPPVLVGAATTLLVCLAVALAARVPLVLGALGRAAAGAWGGAAALAARANVGGALGDARYALRLALGSAQAWMDEVHAAFNRAFGPEDVMLPANDWSVCTLQERMRVGNGCVKYRFKLPGPACVLPLELGQELTLCGLDAAGRVASASCVPLSPRAAQGYVDVVVAKPRPPDAPLTAAGAAAVGGADFARLLETLAIGDEVAARPGRAMLQYRGPYAPITDVVLIACGLGVVPMLQLVRELLPARESSVRAASVVWLNEAAEDFALYGELERAFYKYHRKLDVACIIERDLFGHALAGNRRVREAVPAFRIGTLAVVSGPDFFVAKVRDYLVRQGYPDEVIITV